MKYILSINFLFFFILSLCQKKPVLNNNVSVYQSEIYIPVDYYYNGEKITAKNIDGTIYKNIDGKFYKKATSIEITPQLFGAKGDANYFLNGDINKLQAGTDDTQAIINFLNSRKSRINSENNILGSTFYFPSSIYKTQGNFLLNNSNTKLFGDAIENTIIHALKTKDNNDAVFTFKKNTNGNTIDDLFSGGGLESFTIKTDNSSNRNNAINIVFAENLVFRDLLINGFGKSAIKGGFWESYFDNIKIVGCGAQQVEDEKNNPTQGLIDTSNDDVKRPDGSNNTLINKITFSSNFGTYIKLTSQISQTVNINIRGIYAESYYHDAGNVENLPIIYVSNSSGNTIEDGFFTINSTGIERNAELIRMNKISELKISNLVFSFNPIDGYLKRPVRKLRSIANLQSVQSQLSFRDLIINDQVDGIGYGLLSTPPLIEGLGVFSLSNVTFNLLAISSGGTRRITNLIGRSLKANGDFMVIPTDKNGPITSLRQKLVFNNGKLNVYQDFLPNTIDTWIVGDKILKSKIEDDFSSGWICTQDGTSGDLIGVVGSTIKGTFVLKVNDVSKFLVGDWVTISGIEGYNRIKSVEKNQIILEQKNSISVNNSKISFYAPTWKIINCK